MCIRDRCYTASGTLRGGQARYRNNRAGAAGEGAGARFVSLSGQRACVGMAWRNDIRLDVYKRQMLACMIGGLLVSQHIFAIGNGSAIEFGRHLHLVATAWAFILMSIHLGLHGSIFVEGVKKIHADERIKKAVHLICCVVIAALCAYGLYQFVDRRFWEELFHLVDYQKEYDYSKSLVPYFAESAVLSALFITISYYAKKILLKTSAQRNSYDEKN